MARPVSPAKRAVSPATLMAGARTQVLNGRGSVSGNGAVVGSAAVYRQHRRAQPKTDRRQIAKDWQVEAYRHVNICGEARYAVTLFAAIASRAEIGVSKAQTKVGRPAWVNTGPEVDLLASVMPSVRDRSKFIRDYMTHRVIAGEAYLIARTRQPNDPGYVSPPGDFDGTWEEYARANPVDLFDGEEPVTDPNVPIWELVAVTELRKRGETWEVRYDNDNYIALAEDDPVVRVWWPDPDNRREAWSPIKSLLPTLREIEWLTKHIFTQIRSRLISAGVWFVPDNITFPPPPPDAVEGGAEALAAMNEAEQFMISLADSGMSLLDADEVAFPTVVMASPEALAMVDQKKLIQFWSELDDTAMKLRSDNIRRFALGMDMPPEQILGASGMAVSGSAGAAGSTNHWCVDEETEILTRYGWVRQGELKVGDEVYSLDHEVGVAEWCEVTDIYRAQVENETMVRMRGRDHDSLTTPGHRWPVLRDTTVNSVKTLVREFRLTSQLTEHDRIITGAMSAATPSMPKFSDSFVELAAWFWTEGSLNERSASISQSIDRNPERVDRIRAALAVEFPGGWAEHIQVSGFNDSVIQVFRLHKEAREAMRLIGGKKIENWFIDSLTRSQLELFIDISCQGDGWHYRQGRLDIWQRDPEALVAYERALILSGRAVSWGESAGGTFVSDRRGKNTVRPKKVWSSSSAAVEEESYTGIVWCPVTKNSTWLARRNGSVFFTGNSIWAAEEQTISAHIEPALDDFVHFLTLGLIRRVLPASELVVSYDTSSLRLRQDRSKESIELYDRGALRAATMVRENGFDPTIDMMDDTEFRKWLLVKIAGGSATPEQVQESLRLLGVVLNVDVSGNGEGSGGAATAHPGTNEPRNLDEHPYEGPPRVDHDHNPAPYSALLASCEGLVLRALERAGNRVLNDHKRGRDKDRTTPAHLAHMTLTPEQRQETPPFDFGLAPTMLAGLGAADIDGLTRAMGRYCRDLYASGDGYDRETLSEYLSAGMGSR